MSDKKHTEPSWVQDLTPAEQQRYRQGRAEIEAAKIEASKVKEQQPPPAAMAMYEDGMRRCDERQIPYDKIRVIWWELGGSWEGWYFNGKNWPRPHPTHPGQKSGYPLPYVPTLWLELSPDEAILAGYGDRFNRKRKDLPDQIKITLFEEPTFNAHRLRLSLEDTFNTAVFTLPSGREQRVSRGSMVSREQLGDEVAMPEQTATFSCEYCGLSVPIDRGIASQFLGSIQGFDKEEIQLIYLQTYLGPSQENLHATLSMPIRGTHRLACKSRPFGGKR